PVTPSAVKAPVTIWPSAWGRAVTLTTRMSRMHAVYSTAIAGVSAEVQRAIDFTPPRITAAVRTATTTPMIQPLAWRASLPVAPATIIATWLDWKRLPAPNTPTRAKTAYSTA